MKIDQEALWAALAPVAVNMAQGGGNRTYIEFEHPMIGDVVVIVGIGSYAKLLVDEQTSDEADNLHKAMEDLFTEAHTLLSEGRWDECNELLDIDVDSNHRMLSIGLLRATAPARKHLPKWNDLLERVTTLLGNDSKHYLRGLEPDSNNP